MEIDCSLVHYALEEMKKSLSFISAKLISKESRGNLSEYFCSTVVVIIGFFTVDGNEIGQLQERLASTEAQMCKILTALDCASNKVQEVSKKSRKVSLICLLPCMIVSIQFQTKEEKHYSASKSSTEDEDDHPQKETSCSSDEDEVPYQVENEENHSEAVSSSDSSLEEDQSTPIDTQTYLKQRKHY